MANEIIDDLVLLEVSHDSPKSEVKRQKRIECVLTRNSKQYLGKAYTEEQVNKLSAEDVDKLFSNYEAKLLGQMVKSLGKSIIKMYSMRACQVLGMTNQDALNKDLESDPFLNSALQRFSCELYYRFGSFLVTLSAGLITSRHYFEQSICFCHILNADNARTSYSAVCGSNWSRENAFSLGFTRVRGSQSFRFHCHSLSHPAIP